MVPTERMNVSEYLGGRALSRKIRSPMVRILAWAHFAAFGKFIFITRSLRCRPPVVPCFIIARAPQMLKITAVK